MNFSRTHILLCLIVMWGCSGQTQRVADENLYGSSALTDGTNESHSGADTRVKEDSAGFVSVNGEQMVSLGYCYEADMQSIGLGRAWRLFEKEQKEGALNYEQGLIYLKGNEDDMGAYPFTVFVTHVPGCEGIYLDGIQRAEDGSLLFKQLAHIVKEGEEPEYITYTVSVETFTFTLNDDGAQLDVDITITSDASDVVVRIVFSGPTPNDGMEYMMD